MCDINVLDDKIDLNAERILKTKEYVLRAHRNYYQSHKDDVEFKDKQRQKKQKYREEHKDDYNAKQREYMRTYRAKKKQSKMQSKPEEITIDEVCNYVSNLSCA